MTPHRAVRCLSSVGILLGALASWASVGCSGDGPRVSGTKTDWLRPCDEEADCESELSLSCLCGVCSKRCGGDTECAEGVCGSEIATNATCGNDAPSVSPGERICVPEASASCQVATLPRDALLGNAETVTCDDAGALLCESFDNLLPESHSTWGDGETTAGLVECESQAGAGALRLRAIDGGYTQTRMRLSAPVSGGELHARFYLRVESGSTLPSQLIVFELWDQDEGDVTDRTTIYINDEESLEVYLGPSNVTVRPEVPAPVPRDNWLCLELGLNLDDATGSVYLSVDGSSILERAGVDTLPSDPIGVAVVEGVPMEGSQNTEATFYVDELVVGTQPIGCE